MSRVSEAFEPGKLMSRGLHIPNAERPIDMLERPFMLTRDEHEQVRQIATDLDVLLNKALAFTLTSSTHAQVLLDPMPPFMREVVMARLDSVGGDRERFFTLLEHTPHIRRLDALVAQGEHTTPIFHDGRGIWPIELNAAAPEGMWYYTVARQIYTEAHGYSPENIPHVPSYLNEVFRHVAENRTKGKPTIALTTDPRYISEIEIPRLVEALREDAQAKGWDVEYVVCHGEDIADNGKTVSVGGKPIDVIWNNWGPDVPESVRPAILTDRVGMVNRPETMFAGEKYLMAVLSTDDAFRTTLSEGERHLVDSIFPKTYALYTTHDMDKFMEAMGTDAWFFKSNMGTSGLNVFDGQAIGEDERAKMRDLIHSGNIMIAQRRALPDSPWIATTFRRNGERSTSTTFQDINPYIFNTGTAVGQRLTGPCVVRAKAEHPINVARGGGLGIAAVKN